MFSFTRRRANQTTEKALIAIFEEAALFLAQPDNDYAGSGWQNANIAIREIDQVITQLHAGLRPDTLRMELLFAPSGPMQEVSLRSGWEMAFFQLADRFDCALYAYKNLGVQDRERSAGWLIPA